MERFCKDLREHAAEIINDEKKEMILLIKKINHLILTKMIKMHLNDIIKSEIIVIIQENLEGLLIVFTI